MKSFLVVLGKIFAYLWATIFILSSIGGIIMCTAATDTITLILCIVFSILFFIIGILLFYVASKKIKNPAKECNCANDSRNSTQFIVAEKGTTLLRSAVKKQPEKHSCEQNTVAEKIIPSFSSQYIEDGNTFVHTDESPITDEEIPYLIQLGYEKAVQDEKDSTNPKFHRTEREKELAFEFIQTYDREFSFLVNQFEFLYRSANQTDDLSKRIDLLNHSLIAFEKAKKYAYSKGNGGTIYFQDMYEYLHNSNNSCFSYADLIQNNLDTTMQERDVIIPSILQIVNDNDCILQKNIYAKLPSISKTDIQRIIRKLEAENKITRIKKSSSYELHIVK